MQTCLISIPSLQKFKRLSADLLDGSLKGSINFGSAANSSRSYLQLLGHGTDDLRQLLASLEEDESRHSRNTNLGGNLFLVIDVYFVEGNLVRGGFRSKLLE